MKRWHRHIERLLGGMLMLLLVACASGPTEKWEKPVLQIYLFAPDSPIVTRADKGNVDASAEEKRISTLDVWVFEENTSTLVSNIHLANLTFEGQKVITMEISDEFATKAANPDLDLAVDIYVAANVTEANCGLALDRNSTPADLEAALIQNTAVGDFFGVTSPVRSVPDAGLPMSGLLKGEPVGGIPPVFTAKSRNVQLVRAVSKIRFIFSKSATFESASAPAISDISIVLGSDDNNDDNSKRVLPTAEYLFLEDIYPTKKIHLPTTPDYEANATLVSGISGSDINSCTDPASYIYANETGQAYETKMNDGLTVQDGQTHADLSEVGTFYLRESDRKLTGTIYYTIGETPKSATFTMDEGFDFTRNHTWIVYGYFVGDGTLMLNIVDVKPWEESTDDPKVHNW
jgi:hypothetical protein